MAVDRMIGFNEWMHLRNFFNFWDYVCYRINKFNRAFGDDSDTSGSVGISLLQFIIPFTLTVIIWVIVVPRPERNYNTLKVIAAIFMVPLLILNMIRYRYLSKYDAFHERWGNEEKSRKIRRGWFVFLFVFFMCFLLIADIAWILPWIEKIAHG